MLRAILAILREEDKYTNRERLPQMSNFYCHPARAGGSPYPFRRRTEVHSLNGRGPDKPAQ
jgi:hypothetical protein